MNPCRLFFDECVPVELADAIRKRFLSALIDQVGDPGMPAKGTVDPELIAYCESTQRLLVTGDRTTFLSHVKGHSDRGGHTYGIFILRPDQTLIDLAEDLALVAEWSEAEQWIDQIRFVPGNF